MGDELLDSVFFHLTSTLEQALTFSSYTGAEVGQRWPGGPDPTNQLAN